MLEERGGHSTPQDNGAVQFGREFKIHGFAKQQSIFINFEISQINELLSEWFTVAYVQVFIPNSCYNT